MVIDLKIYKLKKDVFVFGNIVVSVSFFIDVVNGFLYQKICIWFMVFFFCCNFNIFINEKYFKLIVVENFKL